MITNHLEFTTDLAQGVRMVRIGRLFAQSDKEAHTIEIMVKNGSQAADLTGLSASCFLIRSDDSTVNVTGTITGSTVTVTLNASCYEVPGHFSLIVKAYDTDHSTAVFWADGTVTRSTTDSLVDPEHVVPDLATLLAQIETIREATEAAEDAADAAEDAADLATEKAGLADTKAGLADTAATAANTAATSISGMTVAASGLSAGTPPTATVSDVSGHKHIAFGIPAGAAGATGAVPNIQVGTVTTVAPDVSAAVTRRSGSPDTAPIFDFDIPRGQTGSVGAITAGDIPMSSSDQTSVASAIGAIPKTGDSMPLSSGSSTTVAAAIAAVAQATIEQIYPVGAVYISLNSTDPATLFGFGTWSRILGRFLLAADGRTYLPAAQGGEATHTLTVDEMPSHTHAPETGVDFLVYHGSSQGTSGAASGSILKRTDIGATGGGQAHNNMPPYYAVYMWERIS